MKQTDKDRIKHIKSIIKNLGEDLKAGRCSQNSHDYLVKSMEKDLRELEGKK